MTNYDNKKEYRSTPKERPWFDIGRPGSILDVGCLNFLRSFLEVFLKSNLGVFAFFIVLTSLFLIPSSASAATLTKPPNNLGLVGYWSFNEGTSTTAGDFSGNGNNGSLSGFANPPTATSGWGNGKFGKALNFDGSDDYVTMGDKDSFNPSSAITIAGWVNIDITTGDKTIIGKTEALAGVSGEYFLRVDGQKIRFTIQTSAGTTGAFLGNTTLSIGTWYHVAGVWDGSNASIYLNGVSDATPSSLGGTLGNNSSPLTVGTLRTLTTPTKFMDGKIDEVRVYNRALSASEISALYKSGSVSHKVPNNLGLVGYWSMNEGTSTTAGDFSGNGNHGTLQSFANPATAISGWGAGRFGNGLNFDGTNDYISTTKQYTNPQTFTISGWFKTTSANGRKIVGFETAQTGTASAKYDRHIYMGTDGKIYFGWFPGTVVTVVSTNTLNDGKWHHFLATHNGSTGQLFIDGVSQGTNSGTPQSYSGYWRIGGYKLATWTNAGDGYFDGAIDDVRIYDKVLSTEERNTLFLAGGETKINSSQNNRITDGLVGLWSFNGADVNWTSGTTGIAYDRSGNNNTGTLTNMNQVTSPSAGKVGQALNFDGSNDFVNAGSGATLDNIDIKTISAWIKPDTAVAGDIVLKVNAGDVAPDWSFYFDGNNDRIAYYHNWTGASDGEWASPANSVTINTWTHVAVIYNRGATGNVPMFYVNGIELALTTIESPAGASTDDSTKVLTIGANEGLWSPFNGLIDEFRVYNRALSAQEIKQLYLMGK